MSAERAGQLRVPGRAVLSEVLNAYAPFRPAMAADDHRVLIVRFTTTMDPTSSWSLRMAASAVSARQKLAVFEALGITPHEVVLPEDVPHAAFVELLESANSDPGVAAVIVQTPPPARLVSELDRITPAKDIDGLGRSSPWSACATADGINRLVDPFLDPSSQVAVVGSRGFVGRGVVALLRHGGHAVLELDLGDDLRQLREVSIVVSTTGQPGVLGTDHLHRGHQLVVDSGFTPLPTGVVGDVHPDAAHLPQVITPVPGGVGPVEMAVLAERIVQTVEPALSAWRYHRPAAATAAVTTVSEVVGALAASEIPGRAAPAGAPEIESGAGEDSPMTRAARQAQHLYQPPPADPADPAVPSAPPPRVTPLGHPRPSRRDPGRSR